LDNKYVIVILYISLLLSFAAMTPVIVGIGMTAWALLVGITCQGMVVCTNVDFWIRRNNYPRGVYR